MIIFEVSVLFGFLIEEFLFNMKIFGFIVLIVSMISYGESAECLIQQTENCYCFTSEEMPGLVTVGCYFNGLPKFDEIKLLAKQDPNVTLQLDISDLKTKSLKAGMFNGYNVGVLHFNHSDIESIDDAAFEGLQNSLVHLSFKNNTKLSSINFESLKNLKKLEHLEITKSKLTKIVKSEMDGLPKTLIDLYFHNNTILEVEEGAFEAVSAGFIDLSYNNLTTLPRCFGKSAQTIDLSYNKFTEIPYEAFRDLDASPIVYLDGNQIKTISETDMKKLLDKSFYFNVYDNPLECGCDVKFLIGQLFEEYTTGIAGVCTGENKRKGKFLNELTEEIFDDCKAN